MSLYYTYVWKDASGVPFYVGKGTDKRSTFLWNRSPEFKAVHALGGCTVEIVNEFILQSQALEHEMVLIGGRSRVLKHLRNLSAIRTGKRHSLESREMRSVAARMAAPRSDNTSGFKGVSFDKRRGRWNAEISVSLKKTSLGAFQTAEEAARAYDTAAIAAWGTGNCYLNFPPEAKAA